MFYLHCTKKLLDRIKPEIVARGDSDCAGQLVRNRSILEATGRFAGFGTHSLPVLMPLAPASTLPRRFPTQLALVLKEHGVAADYIAQEVWQMDGVRYVKTANRSVVGILNEFVRQAEFWLAAHGYQKGDVDDLLFISAKLAKTPYSPLHKGPVSPDNALQQMVNGALAD